MALLILVGRLLFGGYFVYNGIAHFDRLSMLTEYARAKKIPLPKTAVAFSGLMLIIAGLFVFLGVFAHIGLWLIILFLLASSYAMHDFWDVTDPTKRMNEMMAFSRNMAFIGAALMMFAIPLPWLFSLF